MDFCRINRVAAVVAFSVRDIRDEILRFPELLTNELYDIDISHLIVSADIVDLAHAAVRKDEVNRLAMILHIEPIAHIFSVAVHRQRLVRQSIGNHQRNQFFRELIRSVIVAAARNRHRKAVCPIIRADQEIRARLGAAVGRARVKRRRLREKQIRTLERQIAVHLIRRHLMIALDSVFPARIHQDRRPQNIRL